MQCRMMSVRVVLAALTLTLLVLVPGGAALAPSSASAEQADSKIHRPASGFLAAGARFSCARLDTGQRALLGHRRLWRARLRQHRRHRRQRDAGLGRPGGPRARDARRARSPPASTTPARSSTTARCAAGARARRPARLRQHERHRRQRDAGLGGAGRPRRRANGGRDQRAAATTPARSSTTARCAAGARARAASSATATRAASATTRRRARSGRSTSAPGVRLWRSRAADTTPARSSTTARCAAGATAGSGQLGYGNTEGHRRQRDARLGRPGEARRRAQGRRDLGRLRTHLRAPRQRQGALLGRRRRAASSATATPTTIGDNETPGSVGTREARRRPKGDRDLRRRRPHLRGPRQRHGALLGQRHRTGSWATATRATSATTSTPARSAR